MSIPWTYDYDGFEATIYDSTGRPVAYECGVEQAALIVRCVNAHDQLVGACEAALGYLATGYAARDKLKAALAAIEEE